ncbi:43844_t:CDS:1, partial [Gigaspora margarita]
MVTKGKNNIDEFSDLNEIGEGGFGIISKAKWKRQNHQVTVAIKKLKDENDTDKFKQE